ncbi:hypothetical protein H112_01999 [Trichophyton rubrum D6]|uniref:Uncharacterized protein n=3 Tax=Trichophyton TaxID=5550 RepID=A0A080WII7_TRIRC|nr:uncharacterized protein TERG_12449 [Trichophyton rubrum CBS 118892]EZF25683.1 hypothetical protein H100_01995 [Trichophyton rubrum MR850]EZF44767.1 hypothetical protein H102_01993 [Trichophyton rubrum CBS 100081]EZF55367.1 hypothetical protein H103_02004 [Trichophyton rubrum CBS 288.86]EZF65984.1 hypothetical protein H104_01979 [Trichophyton rubrum CBS 289.86]EZF76653.1 hypothetical protein H105_02009 [Trichophyton soudanense CBS 452.61]EZF87286.1 hypothetical protein H110_02003 [Trichophy
MPLKSPNSKSLEILIPSSAPILMIRNASFLYISGRYRDKQLVTDRPPFRCSSLHSLLFLTPTQIISGSFSILSHLLNKKGQYSLRLPAIVPSKMLESCWVKTGSASSSFGRN